MSSDCPLAAMHAWVCGQQRLALLPRCLPACLPACCLSVCTMFPRLLPGGADSHDGAPPAQRRQSKPRSGFSGCRCCRKRAALFYLCTFPQEHLHLAACLCELHSLSAALVCIVDPSTCRRSQGRMIDHLRNTQSVGLEDLAVLILDEADRLLEMGFAEEVRVQAVLWVGLGR